MLGLGKEGLVKHGCVGTTEQGEGEVARDAELSIVVVDGLVETLVPPNLVEIQVLGVTKIAEIGVHKLGRDSPTAVYQHVVT